MARFLKHTSCPECGSSDAKALYDDSSSFCFSCKFATRASLGGLLAKSTNSNREQQDSLSKRTNPPDDLCSHFAGPALEWLTKYGLGIEDLIKHNVKFSPSTGRIYFTFPGTALWQARTVSPKRYFTSGGHTDILPIYYCGKPVDRVVVVEDCVSAIKIASAGRLIGLWSDAMPLLGTHLPTEKMKGLQRLYSRVDVWLDHDKGKEALKASNRLKLLGLRSSVYFSEHDPKEHTYDELRNKLYDAHTSTTLG